MCRTWEKPSDGELSAASIESLLEQMPRLTWLDVTGGEPFVRRDIEAVLGTALCTPPALTVLHFQTNGWSPDRIAAITERVRGRRQGVDLIVTVSIDGPAAIHDAVRGREGSAARALETLSRLESLPGVEVHVGTTISDRTVDSLPALEEILRGRDFDLRRWHWNWLQTSEHFFGNEAMQPRRVPAGDLLRRHLARRGIPRTLVQLMEAAYLVNLDAVERGEPSGVPCQALRSAAFISPEGDLFPCHLYGRNLGSVKTEGVAAVWNAPRVHEARRDIEALACGGCFSACEAYPALAGAPLAAARVTARRLVQLSVRGRR